MSETRDFWSRRKAAVQAEAETELEVIEASAVADQQAELDAKPDHEILAEFNLPDPDHLQLGDDVSGFMSQAIPDRLRRRALRRLWRLNPVLANVDGLVDYGEDYTDAACVIENIQTAYQVGKGMLAHVEALAADDAEVETPAADTPETLEPETQEEDLAVLAEPADEPVEVAVQSPELEELEDMQMPPAPRRMTFEFEG